MDLATLNVRIFADGADEAAIAELARDPRVSGFTTNPSLLHAAGVRDYAEFAKRILLLADDRPVSFEVLADELDEIEWQAGVIAGWGSNAVVKVPVTNSKGLSTMALVNKLAAGNIAVNVTAVMEAAQLEGLGLGVACYVSVFAGRIADTGRDAPSIIREIREERPNLGIIWASPREVLNVIQAEACGCHAITLTRDLIAKLPLLGKDLKAYSLETVQAFYRDAVLSRLTI